MRYLLYIPYSKCLLTAMLLLATTLCRSQNYEVTQAPFNSEEADFSGAFNGKYFVFSSTRAKTNLSFLEDTTLTFFTDLYVVEMKANGEYSRVENLKGNVNTLYNEGQAAFSPSGNLMVYTGNMKQGKTNKLEKVEEFKLGLFTAERFRDSWLLTSEFPYNSREGKYSVAHPCLVGNDSILYFASNMPGGYGGSDIYRSFWQNNMWSTPENLGKNVNTKGNEFFPFMNEYGVLFFSTNARKDAEGMDIYYTTEENAQFAEPQKLNSTINTEYDEFAYAERPGNMMGTFSSNRNDGVDDIFFFAKYINNYNDCLDNERPTLCYRIVDEKLSAHTDPGFKYRWNMGDGTVMYGNEVEYCFPDYGIYNISLDVIDTATHQVFAKVSTIELDISNDDKPFILSRDTVFTTSTFDCLINTDEFKGFEVEKVEWELSDGGQFRTYDFVHQFKTPGTYRVKCGLVGKRKGKINPRICVYKDIVCVEPLPEQVVPANLPCCDIQQVGNLQLRRETVVMDSLGNRLSPFYRLIIAESEQQLKADNPIFERITEEISELKTETGYEYSISKSVEWGELIPQYEELKNHGIENMHAEIFSETEFQHRLQQTFNTIKSSDVKWPEREMPDSLVEYRVLLARSETKLSFQDPLFEKIDSEITEIKTENGYAYVIERAMAEEELAEALEQARKNGVTEAEIVPMYAREWIQFEEGKGYFRKDDMTADEQNSNNGIDKQNKDATDNGSENSSYRVMLVASEERLSLSDPVFSKVRTEITELSTESGYEYVIENASNFTELSDELATATSMGFEKAEVKEYEVAYVNEHTTAKGFAPVQKPAVTDTKYKYSIVLMDAEERKPFNHEAFSKVEVSISEMKQKDGSGYEYLVISTDNIIALEADLKKYKAAGFENAHIDSNTTDGYKERLVQVGKYIKPRNAQSLNVEFSKLSDIKFEYNSAEIKAESFANLNYIAAMLLLEEDFSLRLGAHTCDIGGGGYNKELSDRRAESVMQYLTSKGIARERLFPKGYGMSKPMADNNTEEGRKKNRRVEFVIVFNMRVTP
ncbi:MAG: OmpA family protein [Flavobacteriales bacterium]